MHQSLEISSPLGARASWGIAGLNCSVLTSALSSQCHGIAGFLFHVQNGHENLHLPAVNGDLNRAFGRALIIRVSLQCWAYKQALEREKSISLLFPVPEGDVVANDWCITFI